MPSLRALAKDPSHLFQLPVAPGVPQLGAAALQSGPLSSQGFLLCLCLS